MTRICIFALVSMCAVAMRTRYRGHFESVGREPRSPCEEKVGEQNVSQQKLECEKFREKELLSWECKKQKELCEQWGSNAFWAHFISHSTLHVEVVQRTASPNKDSLLAVPWREFKSADLRLYHGTPRDCEQTPKHAMWFSSATIAKMVYGRKGSENSVCSYRLKAHHVADEHVGAGTTLKLLDMSDPAALTFLKTHEMTRQLMELGRQVQGMVPGGDACAAKTRCKDCLRTAPPSNRCLHLGAILSLAGIRSGPECYWNEQANTCHKPGNVSERVAVKKAEDCAPDSGNGLADIAFETDGDSRDEIRRNSFDLIDHNLATLLCSAVQNASRTGGGGDAVLHGYYALPMLKGAQMLKRSQGGPPGFPGEAMLCNAADWLELVGDLEDSEELDSILEQEEQGCDEEELDAC